MGLFNSPPKLCPLLPFVFSSSKTPLSENSLFTILERLPPVKHGKKFRGQYACRCACGLELVLRADQVYGKTALLGCLSCRKVTYPTKYCKTCNTEIEPHLRICKSCRRAGARSNENNLTRKYRRELIAHYTNDKMACQCCGESIYEFLTVDHINNDGYLHRGRIGNNDKVIEWARRNKYPEGLQILCWNCNCGRSKSPDKICPHQRLNALPLAALEKLSKNF